MGKAHLQRQHDLLGEFKSRSPVSALDLLTVEQHSKVAVRREGCEWENCRRDVLTKTPLHLIINNV